jgi:hypothetical protein
MSRVTVTSRITATLLLALVLGPQLLSAQSSGRGSNMRIIIGVGRFVPLEPLASAENDPTEYRLADSGVTILAIDYWASTWFGTRLSYQWTSPELEEPEGPSFVRMSSGYLAALFAPVQVGRVTRPYFALGAGLRRYDVNAPVLNGGQSWDLAGRQNRVAAFAGTGVTLRFDNFRVAPEVGAFLNTFRHQFPCEGCPGQKNQQLDMLFSLQLVIG